MVLKIVYVLSVESYHVSLVLFCTCFKSSQTAFELYVPLVTLQQFFLSDSAELTHPVFVVLIPKF